MASLPAPNYSHCGRQSTSLRGGLGGPEAMRYSMLWPQSHATEISRFTGKADALGGRRDRGDDDVARDGGLWRGPGEAGRIVHLLQARLPGPTRLTASPSVSRTAEFGPAAGRDLSVE